MRLAAAIEKATTREVQAPSGLWYRVRAITSYDTLATRAPALLAVLSPRPAPDRRGQPMPKAAAPDAAAKSVIDTVYGFACAGVVAWRPPDGDWEPVRLTESESPGEGEESVAVLPWGDLSAIAEAIGVASGLTEAKKPLSPTMLASLDTLAQRYGIDPWAVAQWPPERLGLALEALEAGVALESEARAQAQAAAKR